MLVRLREDGDGNSIDRMNEVARLEGEALDTDQAFRVELRDHDTLYGGVGRVAQHEPPRTLRICR